MTTPEISWSVEYSCNGTYAEIVVGDETLLRPDEPCGPDDLALMEFACLAVNSHARLMSCIAEQSAELKAVTSHNERLQKLVAELRHEAEAAR